MTEVVTDGLEGAFEAVAQDERIAALEAQLGAMRVQMGRPALDGVKGGEVDPARGAFVERYLRQWLEAGVELKSFSGASGEAGGYAVPREIDQLIGATLKGISPIRGIANVVRTGTAGYRKLVSAGGIVSGWASETGARAETGTPSFNEIAPPSGELYANPAASQAMLDDAQFDVEGWLAGEIAREFGQAEGAAFVNGNGVAAFGDDIAGLEIAEGDRQAVHGDIGHVLRLDHRIAQQGSGLPRRHSRPRQHLLFHGSAFPWAPRAPIWARMKRTPRKLLIALVILALGLIAWHFGLFRAGDCLLQGGSWNMDNGFCRLDSLARPIGQ